MIIEDRIEYIEVSVFDGYVESTGLLTHYGVKSDRLRLLTDTLQINELFSLKCYTITRLIIGKSSIGQDTEEQYIFKNTLEDQEKAKLVILNQLKILRIEGRTTKSGFLTKGTFTNTPEKYNKVSAEVFASNVVKNQRAISLGGPAKIVNKTTTGVNSVYNGQYTNYAKRNVKTIIVIPRGSDLPSKLALKKIKSMVKEVSAGEYTQKFPATASEEVADPPSPTEMRRAMLDAHCGGHMAKSEYFGLYD